MPRDYLWGIGTFNRDLILRNRYVITLNDRSRLVKRGNPNELELVRKLPS